MDEFTTIQSEVFNTYVSSQIFELESLNSLSLLDPIELNKPLKVQPQVKIKDSQGKPIKGKRIIAYSWVDPYFVDEIQYKNSPSNLKFFILKNTISEPSDSNGIAVFKDLTVLGSNDVIGYIHFYSEGVTSPWTDRFASKEYEGALPPRAIYPQLITFPDVMITIENDFERYEKEGEILLSPYVLTVTDEITLNPVSGVS
jgi:hypothetical protein